MPPIKHAPAHAPAPAPAGGPGSPSRWGHNGASQKGSYSLYPSSSHTFPQPMEKPSSKAGHRPEPRARETSFRVPQAATENLLEQSQIDASGEPLISDFHMRLPQMSHSANATPYPGLGLDYEHSHEPSFGDEEELSALPPPDLHQKRSQQQLSVDIPTRASSNTKGIRKSIGPQEFSNAVSSTPTTPDSRNRSSSDSLIFSDFTSSTSTHTLPPLQTKAPQEDYDHLEPVLEDDPSNFDLVAAPQEQATGLYQLEQRAGQMFSQAHLELIFADPKLLLKFTGFLNAYRPHSIRMLVFYLDALKALRAIKYANAIAESLSPFHGHDFTKEPAVETTNATLQAKADEAFRVLVRDDLPAYIAHNWIQVVSTSVQRRITGTLAPHLREASEGLAEVFCLSDPSRPDNPIVFASEEFSRTTQYGMGYSIGRNCRFLQGPHTSPHSVRRLAKACQAGKEHSEVFMNYRRDGSPFMNLLMIAPLIDSKGTVRYFLGAQVDVSGLLKECTDLPALEHLLVRESDPDFAAAQDRDTAKDDFQALAEMFNNTELETVRRSGGRMHNDSVEDEDDCNSIASSRPRLLLKDPSSEVLEDQQLSRGSIEEVVNGPRLNGKLQGVYQNYLLVRPAPSLRILFTSPSLRVPGILQSPFLSRVGGSSRVRADLAQALSDNRGVTAKIRWLARPNDDGEGEGRRRWIHCTPLLGHSGAVGVWMIVLIDEEGGLTAGEARRRFRPAPPVSTSIAGKEYDEGAAIAARERMAAYQARSHIDLRGNSTSTGKSPSLGKSPNLTTGGPSPAMTTRPTMSRGVSRDSMRSNAQVQRGLGKEDTTLGQAQNRARVFHVAQQDKSVAREYARAQTAMMDYGSGKGRPQSQQSFVLK